MECFWMGIFLFQPLRETKGQSNFEKDWSHGGKAGRPYRKERGKRKSRRIGEREQLFDYARLAGEKEKGRRKEEDGESGSRSSSQHTATSARPCP